MDKLNIPTSDPIDNNYPTIPDQAVNPESDRIAPRQVATGLARGTQQLGSPNIVSDPANLRIYVNDNTTDRVTFGKIGDGANDWGLKVSEPGIDVDTATDDQLIFDSSNNTFKITGDFTMTTTLPIAATSQYQQSTHAHGLGYVPAFNANITLDPVVVAVFPGYVGLNGSSATMFLLPAGTGNLSPILHANVSVDATNFYFTVYYGGSIAGAAMVFTAKVYQLQQTAS